MKLIHLTIPPSVNLQMYKLFENLINQGYDPYVDTREIEKILSTKIKPILDNCKENERVESNRILDVILDIKTLNKKISFLVKNAPIDMNLPSTPTSTDDFSTNGKGWVSEYFILLINSSLGLRTILSSAIQNAHPIHNIIPRFGAENEASNRGSLQPFPFHTEASYQPDQLLPDYVSLLCLKSGDNDDFNFQAKTRLIFIDEILDILSPYEIEILQKPYFKFKSGAALDNNDPLLYEGSILSKRDNGVFQLRYINNDRLESLTTEGHSVLSKLKKILSTCGNNLKTHEINMKPGVGLWVHNRTVMHGRESFRMKEKIDSNARWLQRSHGKKNIYV